MAKDTVYQSGDPGEPFRFNAEVAAVFPDMLRRSIPGYEASLDAIGALAARYVRPYAQRRKASAESEIPVLKVIRACGAC